MAFRAPVELGLPNGLLYEGDGFGVEAMDVYRQQETGLSSGTGTKTFEYPPVPHPDPRVRRTKCVKVTNGSTADAVTFQPALTPVPLATIGRVELDVYVEGVPLVTTSDSNPNVVGFDLMCDATGAANNGVNSRYVWRCRTGWNRIVIDLEDWNTPFGSAALLASANVLRFRLTVKGHASQNYSVWFAGVRIRTRERPSVVFVVDDNRASWHTLGRPLMQERALPYTMATICDILQNGGGGSYTSVGENSTTRDQLLACVADDGADCIAHTLLHTPVGAQTQAQIAADFGACRDLLREYRATRGVGDRLAAWVGGSPSANGFAALLQTQFLAAYRASEEGYPTGSENSPRHGAGHRYYVDRHQLTENTGLTSAQAIARVDHAIRMQGPVHFMLHGVIDQAEGATGNNVVNSTGFLRTFLDGVALRRDLGLVDVMTAGDYFAQIGPRELAYSQKVL